MDGDAVEVRYRKRAEKLIYLAGLSSFLVSIIYVLAVTIPLVVFHGFIQGFYSPIAYDLVYAYNMHRILLPHTEYIRFVVIIHVGLSLFLAVSSMASIIYARKNTYLASGLAYGVSLALVVLYGLLHGYIFRAVSYDMSLLSISTRNGIVYETLAGEIWFIDTRLEYTIPYQLVFNTPILLILLFISIIASTSAIVISLYALYEQREANGESKQLISRAPMSYTAVFLVSLVLFASVFTYYPLSIIIRPQQPPATLETPLHMYTCVNISRTTRGALAYTDFETYPVPGWTSYGGVWELSADGGFKGNALRGRDNNGGVGGVSSQYHWNTRIDGYASLWVSVRTRAEGADGYKGIGLMNADRTRLYEISVQSTATIYKWDGTWRSLGSTSVPGYSATRWYTLVLYYVDRGTSVDFTLWIYNETGGLVASLSASDTGGTRFRPAYAGVTIDAGTTLWFRFDDFIVSTVDPRSIMFTGFIPGMRVEVWDNLGNLVNSTVAPASSFYLNITSDIVVGTGVDGRVVVRYPDTLLCGVLAVPVTDAILGGDTYALTTRSITLSQGANKTSANLTIYISGSTLFNTTARILRVNASQVLYARLFLNSITPTAPLYLDIWLEGATRSTNISIVNGTPVSVSTSVVQLNTGLNNNITLTGYFGTTGRSTTLSISLELCTAPGNQGACVYYPLILVLVS